MKAETRRRTQLVVSIVVLVVSAVLIGIAGNSLEERFQVLDGCWGKVAVVNGTSVPTARFWAEWVAGMDLDPISRFLYARGGYTILLFLMGLCALGGCCGMALLRIAGLRAGFERTPSMTAFVALLPLGVLAGCILFLLLVGPRLMLEEDFCLSRGYAYSSMAASLIAGLFLPKFFDWLEARAPAWFEGKWLKP